MNITNRNIIRFLIFSIAIISIILIVIVGLGFWGLYNFSTSIVPWGVPGISNKIYQVTTDTQIKTFKLPHTSLHIPSNYIWHSFGEGGITKSIQMHVSFPNFQPATRKNIGKFKFPNPGRSKINIQLKYWSDKKSFEKNFDIKMVSYYLSKSDYKTKLLNNGLTQYENINIPKNDYNLYVRVFKDKSTFLARCPKSGNENICRSLIYSFPGFYVKTTFLKENLGDYQRIHTAVYALLKSFQQTTDK